MFYLHFYINRFPHFDFSLTPRTSKKSG